MRVPGAISVMAAAAALSIAAAPAQAATLLQAGWNTGCGKTTCFNDQGVFTRTWTSQDAAGPLTISQLLLDRSVLGSLDSSTFRLSFQLNGKEVGSWGSFTMGGINGDELLFNGEAFTWNPEDGELTLVLEIFKPGGGGGFGRLSAPNPGVGDDPPSDDPPRDGPPQGDEGDGFFYSGGAVATAFNASAAPEPAAWALMIAGFGLAGARLRRRDALTG